MTYALIVSIIIIFSFYCFNLKSKISITYYVHYVVGIFWSSYWFIFDEISFQSDRFIGITSLCGIVVRNGIILVDYLQELRTVHGFGVKEAALAAGKRRMRPHLSFRLQHRWG